MTGYCIRLTSEDGQTGWFCCISERGIITCPSPALAQRWDDENDIEQVLLDLETDFGLNREEAEIVAIADDDVAALWLDPKEATGLSVERDKKGDHLLLVRYGDGECSVDVPAEVAEKLAKVIVEVRQRLRTMT